MKIAKPDGEKFHPTLILVGTRLGIDKITPVYWEALVASLQMPQSAGIAGYVLIYILTSTSCWEINANPMTVDALHLRIISQPPKAPFSFILTLTTLAQHFRTTKIPRTTHLRKSTRAIPSV